MPDFRTIPIDFDSMLPGTFYEVQTNKDNATALIPVDLANPKIHKNDLSTDDFTVDEFGIVTLVGKATAYTEINSNVDLDGPRNYVVDTKTLDATVTVNIPYEEESAFTVHDSKKNFDDKNCIITIRDEADVIAHMAVLSRKDRSYVFYKSNGIWKYNEVGKGSFIDIASHHDAVTDFPDEDRLILENVILPENQWVNITYPEWFRTLTPNITVFDGGGYVVTHALSEMEVIDSSMVRLNAGVGRLESLTITIYK